MSFTFATAGSIRFGAGVASELPGIVSGLGNRVLLVTGTHPERTAPVHDALPVTGRVTVGNEPTMDDARRAVVEARAAQADVVVAVGGGSAIDLAKAAAILLVSGGDPLDHAEVIGKGRPLPSRSVPVVALPTTAGTGSEVSANAVLRSPDDQVKVSLRSPAMLPRVALVDPELTLHCPPQVTASSGMDAFTQCLEPLTSPMATPMTDGFCRTGLEAGASSIRQAFAHGHDLEARTGMSLCSLMGGLALANAKLGAVHGLAGPLGGMTGAPHGALCAALLPEVTLANVRALASRDPENPAIGRYREAARIVTGDEDVDALARWLRETVSLLGIGGLARLGLDDGRVDEACQKAARSSSMKGNPVALSADELAAAVRASM